VLFRSSKPNDAYKLSIILLSGTFLGLSIFVKTPTIAMIPLIGFLVYKNAIYKNNISVKVLGLWLVPVILIPLIAPIYANSFGLFNVWWDGIMYQAKRGELPLFDLTGEHNAIKILFAIDPLLMALGIIGLIMAVIKKDLFLLLWIIPCTIFYYTLGYVQFYFFIPIIPALCIASARLVLYLVDKIKYRNNKIQQILPFSVTSIIVILGFTSTLMLITTNINSTHFEAAAFIAKHIPHKGTSESYETDTTLIRGNSRFLWVLKYAYHEIFNDTTYWTYKSPNNGTEKVVMIIESGDFYYWKKTEPDKIHEKDLLNTYNNSQIVLVLNRSLDAYFQNRYPYNSLTVEPIDIGRVEIRANREAASLFYPLKS